LAHSTSTTRSIQPYRSTEQAAQPSRRLRRAALAGALWLTALLLPALVQARDYLQLFVTQPYLELHTGAGRGYPVFHVVPRGDSVDVLFRRTDWFKVRTAKGVEGWASQADMHKTVLADGTAFVFDLGDRNGFTNHDYELGLFAGAYGGANYISSYFSFSFNSQLAAELAAGQFLGRYDNGETVDVGLTHVFVPAARWSPFVMLGVGEVFTQPKATLVTPTDRREPSAYVGGGIRYYLTRRFFLRGEYKAHWIFTTRNSNEEADEWKLGFAFFF
jgi:uncharacterized protein YraI